MLQDYGADKKLIFLFYMFFIQSASELFPHKDSAWFIKLQCFQTKKEPHY